MFGPLNDYECSCGKKAQPNQKFCPICEVEYTFAKVRRYRLGYIQLVMPVTHIWYLKGRPSYIPIVLNFSRKKTESLTYCTQLINQFFWNQNIHFFFKKESFVPHFYFLRFKKKKHTKQFLDTKLSQIHKKKILKTRFSPIRGSYLNKRTQNRKLPSKVFKKKYFCLENYFFFEDLNKCYFFNIFIHSYIYKRDQINPYYKQKELQTLQQTGTRTILDLLKKFSIKMEQETRIKQKYKNICNSQLAILLLERQIRLILLNSSHSFIHFDFTYKNKLIQRLKIIRYFTQQSHQPNWMILVNLPVLPPDLRPILQLNSDQIAISDLNKLYQKVLFRNKRLQKLLKNKFLYNFEEINYAQRLLQESIDALIENGKSGSEPLQTNTNRPFKSLSDMLKGKKGRFRQNLLGKRVDYSGRSVIIVGAELKVYECGLPFEMAIELFQPFLLKNLIKYKKAKTILGAKRLIQFQKSVIKPILGEILVNYPIFINRAPTLHRLSIQAFQPVIVEGKAILLHPLVCSAFNADFDGDQMAVHIPLSFEARAEAWKLLWSINNFLSPATGQPILMPTQDIVLGCYYLTVKNLKQFYKQTKINNHIFKIKDVYHYSFLNTKLAKTQPIWLIWNHKIELENQKQRLLELQIYKYGHSTKIYPQIIQFYNYYQKLIQKQILTTIGRLLFFLFLNQI
uniref:DNA-directed RNA polymerase subunit n=1 Tax=Codium arenicola TaxID=1191365 RepID=A0A2P0QJ06_9CHLO|nr:RNA polymerase b-subunit [Codium arenicola]ARO74339.1 RNA polymerase b-subunit [Codium arenicola]